MFFLTVVAVGLGLVVGTLRGGSLESLARLRIRFPWLVVVAWLTQVLLFGSPLGAALEPHAGAVHFGSLLLLGVVVVGNRAVPGLAFLAAGLLMNAVVLAANGGFMPVADTALMAAGSQNTLEAMRGGARIQKTFLMAPDTPLWVLGDTLPFAPIGKVYSVGDLVAAAGAFLLVAGGLGRRQDLASV